ncbi:uncharacterized protein PFL1_06517 [Pseudozyma flocculosa PF-1]|uniref:Conserved oligomeric Golgi complex subunit 5 n=1 Tax=Pseudozyma flocculosa PF-1 TaxID=1277687 RepID=A0A061H0L3_9BASI|nr:uncharacterized protein PFL1_06517 [Pseudozyma flocculosa PF-1]EPQ25842.1 hypothetical protein PFL1_06517 [Pseudozyma flocculosa PF-1]
MSAESSLVDLDAFLQPNFDVQAVVAQLLAKNHLLASASRGPNSADASRPAAATTVDPSSAANGSGTPSHIANDAAPASGELTLEPPADRLASAGQVPLASSLRLDQDEGDLSLAISRLNVAIDEIQSSINAEVEANASQLLGRVAGISRMEQRLSDLRSGVAVLDGEVAGLRAKVHEPFIKLQQHQRDLVRIDAASDLVAKASRFVTVARRLEAQMDVLFGGDSAKAGAGPASDAATGRQQQDDEDAPDAIIGQVRGRELARAALIINEITSMLERDGEPAGSEGDGNESPSAHAGDAGDGPSLLDLDFVKHYLPSIDEARQTVTDYMEDMVVRGLRDLSPIMLSSSLQTAYNLGTLPDLVRDLLADLTEVVRDRIRAAFDMASLGRELGGLKEPTAAAPSTYASYKGRRQAAPDASAQATATATWTAALFRRLETLIVVEMGAVCSKVYTLERVLRLKMDAQTGVNFLDEALQVLGDRPSLTFWTTLASSFEAQSKEAARRSPFVAQILSSAASSSVAAGGPTGGYAALLRLFHQFFAKVSVYTDIAYTVNQQSPETVIVLRSLSHLEGAYLDAATAKMSETVQSALGPRRSPTVEEGESAVRAISNLLDAARFDPLLSKAAARRVEGLVEDISTRIEKTAARDATAYTLQAHDTTASQLLNAGLASFACSISQGLGMLAAEQTDPWLSSRLSTLSREVDRAWQDSIGGPLITTAQREIATTLARMHQANLGKSGPAAGGGSGGAERVTIGGGTGSSVYMDDLCDEIWYLREKLLARYGVGLIKSRWALGLARWTLRVFLLHASLLRPLSEAGKLKLTADMTALEFAIEQLVTDLPCPALDPGAPHRDEASAATKRGGRMDISSCGAVWKALRAFRSFLFLSTPEILDAPQHDQRIAPIPKHLVAHHLLGRTESTSISFQWPYERKGWTRKQYVDWILALRGGGGQGGRAEEPEETEEVGEEHQVLEELLRHLDASAVEDRVRAWIEMAQQRPSAAAASAGSDGNGPAHVPPLYP